MYRLHLYLPDELRNQLLIVAKASKKSKAEVVREAIGKGLKLTFPSESNSARALLNLAKLAEKLPSKPRSPKDLSKNHDYYAWGGRKK